jgi:hypothetical protein
VRIELNKTITLGNSRMPIANNFNCHHLQKKISQNDTVIYKEEETIRENGLSGEKAAAIPNTTAIELTQIRRI